MKKILIVFLVLLLCNTGYTAQWEKDKPDGTTQYVDEFDNEIQDNQDALDRLFSNYRRGAAVRYASSSTYTVGAGEITVSSAAGVRLLVKNSSATTVTPSLSASTTYYIYAYVNSTSTETFSIETSTNASTPSGTYYRRLGMIVTDGSSNITYVKNDDISSALRVKLGTVSISSTGNKSITGLGFKPITVFFTAGPNTAGQSGPCTLVGIMTENAQYSTENHGDNASWAGGMSTTAMVGRGGNGSPQMWAFDYVSFDSDGFTVNVSDADSNTTVFYMAIG